MSNLKQLTGEFSKHFSAPQGSYLSPTAGSKQTVVWVGGGWMYPVVDISENFPFGAQYVDYKTQHTPKTTKSWEARLPTTLNAYM